MDDEDCHLPGRDAHEPGTITAEQWMRLILAAADKMPRCEFATATPAGDAPTLGSMLELLFPPATAGSSVEIVGGFDAGGAYLGPVPRPVIMRPEASGVYGQAGHVLFVDGPRLAVAVRSRNKAHWPLGLDFTAAGVSAPGETERDTLLREAREELNLDFDPGRLCPVSSWVPADGYCSRATLWTYPWDARQPIPFNAEDIEEIRWLTLDELLEEARLPAREMKTDLRRFLRQAGIRTLLEIAGLTR